MPIPVEEHPLFIEGHVESFIEDIKIRFGIQELPQDLEERIRSVRDLILLVDYKKVFFESQTLEEFMEKLKRDNQF